MSKIGVVLHQQKTLGAGPEALRMGLADAGYADPPWSEVPKSSKAPKEVRRLLDAGIDRLLVWGGDGMVRRCIDTLVTEDADVEVAILPAGTANLLAKALSIPIDLDAALDVALHGIPRRIDVGVINGEAFAVMAGTGFDALMIRDADDSAKERFGRVSYVKAAARHLGTAGAEATIHVDGQPWFEGRAACVLIGNVGRILGGIHVFPDARLDDGQLDVGVLTASGRADWLRARDAGAGRPHRLVAAGRHDQGLDGQDPSRSHDAVGARRWRPAAGQQVQGLGAAQAPGSLRAGVMSERSELQRYGAFFAAQGDALTRADGFEATTVA